MPCDYRTYVIYAVTSDYLQYMGSMRFYRKHAHAKTPMQVKSTQSSPPSGVSLPALDLCHNLISKFPRKNNNMQY